MRCELRLFLLAFLLPSLAFAQDVLFTNARVYGGGFNVISKGRPAVDRVAIAEKVVHCADEMPGTYTKVDSNQGIIRHKIFSKCDYERQLTSFLVSDGKIKAFGPADALRKLLTGPKTQVIDLHGAFVMPGFNDAHAHLANGGFEKLNVNLIGTKSLAEMQSRIAARVKDAKPGEWIVGRGWDHTKWDVKETPTRADIDKVTGEHPAIFTRVDGHIAIANSAALKAATVTKETKDPQGGKIDRDANGEPTGIMRETSMSMVWSKVPEPTKEQRRKAIELALADAAKSGVTSAQDNSSWEDFLIYEEMEKEGKLTLRISEWLPFDAPVEQLEKMRAHHDAKDPMLHTGMLKGFMDGSLGSGTAALLAPYTDNHSTSGIPRYTQEQLNRLALERAQKHFQMGFHAIGDRGAEMALDAFAYAKATVPAETEMRNRIEHDQVIAPDQFEKY